jgi:hypothetical protein
LTPEQRAAIAAGQRRAWADPEIHARRSAAIAKAQDDPLHRAVMSRLKSNPASRRGGGLYDALPIVTCQLFVTRPGPRQRKIAVRGESAKPDSDGDAW